MNKKEIIEKIIQELEVLLEEQNSRMKKIERDRMEAPSFMQSASDTTRSEKQKEGDDYKLKIQNTKDSILYFKEIDLMGKFIKIKDEDKNNKIYLMVEKGGGIVLREEKIMTISSETPIFRCLENKKRGDTCVLKIGDNEKKLKILEIN